MSVRAKFRVDTISQVSWSAEVRVIKMAAVSAEDIPENERYHKYTPSGTIEIVIDNPPAAEQFKLGESYYVDFTAVVPKP